MLFGPLATLTSFDCLFFKLHKFRLGGFTEEIVLILQTCMIFTVLIDGRLVFGHQKVQTWLHKLDLVLVEQLIDDSFEPHVLVYLDWVVLLLAKVLTLKMGQFFRREVAGRLHEVKAEEVQSLMDWDAALIYSDVLGFFLHLLALKTNLLSL